MSELTEKQQKRHIYRIIFGIFIAFILVLTMILFATRYGGKPLAGTYDIYSYTNDGKEDIESVNKLKGYGMNIEIIFNTDKTGTITYSGGASSQTRTFAYDNKNVVFDNKEDSSTEKDSGSKNSNSKKQTASYTHSGNFITLKLGDEIIKFKRVEKSAENSPKTTTKTNTKTTTNSNFTNSNSMSSNTSTTNSNSTKSSSTKTTSSKK